MAGVAWLSTASAFDGMADDPLEGIPLGRDAGSLPQFQRAAVIRETFFPPGSAGLALRLEFKPVEMDALKRIIEKVTAARTRRGALDS